MIDPVKAGDLFRARSYFSGYYSDAFEPDPRNNWTCHVEVNDYMLVLDTDARNGACKISHNGRIMYLHHDTLLELGELLSP